MSAPTTGCSREGDESVKAVDGLDEAATNSAAPAMAASNPVGTSLEIIVSSVPQGVGIGTRYLPISFRAG
jgi:hypothetical protein